MAQSAKSSATKNPATVGAANAAATTTAKTAGSSTAPTAAERAKMIADAAYFLAQKRGFGGGKEREDWLTAEKQVDSLLKKRG